ncbi:saccharopine dehydrogenase [Aliikangiella marina]|uniref:Saccharopine dehydrogenase n=1 Tax=Aliikangiella marina TaxID=1712262 RepID=A0A545T4H2_9GAMM|nr:saccharopine dehydrogenase NADP-binding domain-containing protein [Aliikangiella marina]TQV72120.1 saccharopine dehydrogenase [Aliikangiella marina]
MRILVIGGYGTFGKRLVESLVNFYQYEIIVAGRSGEKLAKTKHYFSVSANTEIETAQLDVTSDDIKAKLSLIKPNLVINAAGPYQLQKGKCAYGVAKACIEYGCHYIDLADDSEFVTQFSEKLNQQARDAGVILVTGTSTIPALTDAVIRHYLTEFKTLQSVEYGISPGNHTERGKGTVGSILSYTGRPFETLSEGQWKSVFGWQDIKRYDFGSPIGKRWMSNCEIPDLKLLPAIYPQVETVRFQAGLELGILHIGLWVLSWLRRINLIKNLSRYAHQLLQMSYWFYRWGSDVGGMYLNLKGLDKNGKEKAIYWQLVAEKGTGPNVPTIAAELLVEKIQTGQLSAGARPCINLFSLEEFFQVARRWEIYQKEVNYES